jgi:hypothetical protein
MPAKGFPWLTAWVTIAQRFVCCADLRFPQVLHRLHERRFVSVVYAAIKAASARMNMPRPAAVLDANEGLA